MDVVRIRYLDPTGIDTFHESSMESEAAGGIGLSTNHRGSLERPWRPACEGLEDDTDSMGIGGFKIIQLLQELSRDRARVVDHCNEIDVGIGNSANRDGLIELVDVGETVGQETAPRVRPSLGLSGNRETHECGG